MCCAPCGYCVLWYMDNAHATGESKMDGTEKQVAWAEEIRARIQPMVAETVAKTLESLDPDNAAHQELGERYEAIVAAEMARTDAKHWIERWGRKGEGWVLTCNARWIKQARHLERA